jgi:DMSO/TMAO reductase YedYZ molybdopterin-dependent catalytic subunit
MSEVLQRAGVRSGAQMLHFTRVDGYTENMSVEKAMQADTFLVYKLNGEPLPKIPATRSESWPPAPTA